MPKRLALLAIALFMIAPTTAAGAPTALSPDSGKALRTAAAARPLLEWELPEGEQACQVNLSRDKARPTGVLAGEVTHGLQSDATAFRVRAPLAAGKWFWEIASRVPTEEDLGHGIDCYEEPLLTSPLRSVVVPYVLRSVRAGAVFHYGEQTQYYTVKFWTTADDALVTIIAKHGSTLYFSGVSDGESSPWKTNTVRLGWELSSSIPCGQKFNVVVTVKAGPKVEKLYAYDNYFTCT